MLVPIEISARHIHLSQEDLGKLFGKNYQLKKLRDLSQPGQFAAEEILDIQKNERKISKVRIVGPIRSQTQVELSFTDAINLRMEVPLRSSGDLKGTPGITLIGPQGEIEILEGVIVPWRHLHLSLEEGKKLELKNGDFVSLKIKGDRKLIFNKVKVRISKDYKMSVHLDTDEGNAAGILKKGEGEFS